MHDKKMNCIIITCQGKICNIVLIYLSLLNTLILFYISSNLTKNSYCYQTRIGNILRKEPEQFIYRKKEIVKS